MHREKRTSQRRSQAAGLLPSVNAHFQTKSSSELARQTVRSAATADWIEVELREHRDNVCAAARSYEQKLRDKLTTRGAAAPAEVAPLLRSELLKSNEETGDSIDSVADRMFAARMFAALDENGDGVITREEFQ
eukprot:COSAG03_NODE_13286_length_509_cov_0.753659_1_plen_133_part_10